MKGGHYLRKYGMYCVNLDIVISLQNIAVIETSLLDKFLALPLKSGCLFSLTFLFEECNILSASKDISTRKTTLKCR